jgi:hypothetical protein
MKLNKVTIKKLVDVANENWGYKERFLKEKNSKSRGAHIATILDILIGNDTFFRGSTANIRNMPCLEIWNPFVSIGPEQSKKNKIIGYYTLTEEEWEKITESNYVEESKKAFKTHNIDNVCKIALALYNNKEVIIINR